MKNLKLTHYSDAGHGWIAVKRTVLIQLGIADKISQYSYQSKTGSTAYLEEDSDASKLVNALKAQGIDFAIDHVDNGDRSRIRSMPRYETYPTLESIRNAESFEQLKPAVRFLCDKMQKMTWGEFNAFKRTLETQAVKVGSSVSELNAYAEQFQVFGYEVKN